ncbi:hypothetical protein GOOTI_060_00120 [Gordonia otitidis NBRC 100426]|uniref:Rv3660c-like CheY-like N-terminal domain-containing protein n=2 Tax=Gordonia otitidis TaxID=249058 RepID=H5TIJ1_GORO1|nr:hypothetical protein GOOTI_060_00120 [Gordonia otitidis NBRC 100426]
MLTCMSDHLLSLVEDPLLDDVARCAAAAGYRIVSGDAHDCRRDWLTARAVLVDPPAVAVLAEGPLPRRGGVVLISDVEPASRTWRDALDLGAVDSAVLPIDEAHLVRILTELRLPAPQQAGAFAFISAHGGAGASTLAVASALAAVDSGERVLLLDIDDLGAGLDLTLGLEGREGLRWQDLSFDDGAVNGESLRNALPRYNEMLAVVTGRRDGSRPLALSTVLAAVDAGRAHGDLVIADLPRADTPVVRAVAESAELVVVVTTPTVAGTAAARLLIDRLLTTCARVELVIRGPAPGGLRAAHVADTVGVPLIATIRPDPRLPARLEAGRMQVAPRSPLGRAARSVYARLADARAVGL